MQYRKILDLYFQGISQRTISSSTGHSRDSIRKVVNKASDMGILELTDEMTDNYLGNFCFQN